MPTLTINGTTYDVEKNKRLVLAIEDSGLNILHRCGGYARCTTCRVKFNDGEPNQQTIAEQTRIAQNLQVLADYRLSCQILCTHDMDIEPQLTLESERLDNSGKRPEDNITPEPEWVEKA